MTELSVLIVNYNSWGECAAAVASLRRHGPKRSDGSPMPFECIVVDNLSPNRDPTLIAAVERELRLLAEQQQDPQAGRLILHTENGGYSKGMNLAFAHSRGRLILVSNPDVVFVPGLIDALQRHLAANPRAGCVVPKGFWDPERTGHLPPNTLPTLADALITALGDYSVRLSRWYARRLARSWVRTWSAEAPVALPMMSGCMFLIDRGYFESIGRFDERYPLYYEDTDLSMTIRKSGRDVVQVPDAHLVHLVNRSGMSDPHLTTSRHDTSRALYYRKWYGALGTWMLKLARWLVTNPQLERFRGTTKKIVDATVDLGAGHTKPELVFPRRCERFLVLMSLDLRGYLSGGTFGSGDRWTPNDAMWANFPATTFFFTAFDLTGGRFEPIGHWKWRSLTHLSVPVVPLPAAAPKTAPVPVLSVVVLSWNTQALTLRCLHALFAEQPRHRREVIVVDNGSADGSADAIAAAFPHVQLLRNPDNRLYAAGNNQGVAVAAGEFVCTLNSDTEVRPGALDRLVDFLRKHRWHGAVAPKLVDPDGSVQRACQRFPTLATALCFDSWWGTFWPGKGAQDRYLMRDFDHRTSCDVDQPPGACFMMRTAEWRSLGGFDERLSLFYNDVDLCRRLWWKGRRIHYLAEAEVMHHRGASTKNFAKMLVVWHKNRLAYFDKHYGLVGRTWVRLCVRLRIWEEWWKIGRRNPHDATRRRDERDYLRKAAAELWS